MGRIGILFLLFFLVSFSGFAGVQMDEKRGRGAKSDSLKPEDISNNGMLIDAKRLAITGNPKDALSVLRRYVDKYPLDPVGFFELGQLEANLKGYTDALDHVREATRLDPKNVWYLLFLAELDQLTGNLKEATEIYEKLTENSPSNMDYCYQLASLYLQQEAYNDAIRIYNRIEEKSGVTEEMSLQKQKIFLHQNDLKGAEQELKTLISAYPAESRYVSILAEFYMANGMPEKALEKYKEVSVMDPENAYIHMSMADYYRKTGNKEKSYEELKLGFANPRLDIDSKVSILLSFYTVNQLYNDLKEQAFTLASILTATHPNDAKAWSIYGDLLAQDKKYTEAREAFMKVIALDSNKYAVWEEILRLDIQMGDFNHLITVVQRAIELFPDQPLPYLFSGLANFQLKNYGVSLKDLTTGSKLVADNDELLAQFYMYIGDTEHALKNDEGAFKAYETSLKIKDGNGYVLNNYAYYLAVRGVDLERAEQMARKAVALDPENSSFQDTYGWVLYRMGKYTEAREWIGKALNDKEGASAEVMEHYGDVMFRLGDTAQALEYWQKAKIKGDGSALLEQKIAEKKLIE